MQATITIEDELLAQAGNIAALDDNNKIIELALKEFIANHQHSTANPILDLFGTGGIRDDYDYKNHRCGSN